MVQIDGNNITVRLELVQTLILKIKKIVKHRIFLKIRNTMI